MPLRRGTLDRMQTLLRDETHCPGCCSHLRPADQYCLCCGIWLAGPEVAELRWIDSELGRVDAARARLIGRRAVLLGMLPATRRRPAPGAAGAGVRFSAAGAAGAAGQASMQPEVSARVAARLLLAAGATLVVIAVIVFTVADWARIGPLGRCGILLAATALVLAAPRVLVRRGLNATAESVAAIGLALTIADAELARRLIGWHPADGALAVAAAASVLAGAWAAYGAATRLNGPKLAAIGLAQLPCPLAAVGLVRLGGGPAAAVAGPIAIALVLNSVAGLALADWADRRGHRAEAAAGSAAAVAMWLSGVLTAAAVLAAGAERDGRPWLAAALTAAALVGILGARRRLAALAWAAAVVSGALLAVGLAVPLAGILPAGWRLAAVACCGGLVGAAALAVGRWMPRRGEPAPGRGVGPAETAPDRSAGPSPAERADLVAAGAAAVLAVTAVLSVPVAIAGLFPARWPLAAWSGPARYGLPVWPDARAAAVVLALTALACTLVPARLRFREAARATGLVAVALAGALLPAAAHLNGWAALGAPTATALVLFAAGAMLSDGVLAGVAAAAGVVLAASVALRSLSTPGMTIAELAVLTIGWCAAAARARHLMAAALSTAGALAAVTGLAWAIPLASGWPARYAAFAALGVAVAAVGAATWLRTKLPVHSVVLDLGACSIALLSAALTAGKQEEFALLAVAAALAASVTAWLRTGARRELALVAAAGAVLGALATQSRALARALLAPGRMIAQPWRGHMLAYIGDGRTPGLAFAVVILAVCLAALATAAGAWRGQGRASLDAVALALPVAAAPAGAVAASGPNGGLGYWLTVAGLLALTLTLTAWAVLGQSTAPAGAGLVAAALTLAWALAAPVPTLVVLGCLTVAYPLAAWRSRAPVIGVAAVCLAVLAGAGLAECSVLAAHGAAWQAGLAVLGVAAAAQVAAARLARESGPHVAQAGPRRGSAGAIPFALAVECAGWLVTVIGVGQSLARPQTAGLALAVTGLICLGVAARPDRRPAIWAALALLDVASCCWLGAAGVRAVEPYTVPAAVLGLTFGWTRCRREPAPHSWLALGPGLALLLLPSLVAAWPSPDWIRPTLLGVAAVGVALAGARAGKQAPLVTGIAVVVLDAGRALEPVFGVWVHALPSWIPIAVLGAVMLWAGATYEARLRNLRAIVGSLAAMS